jgi:hypothetical protein
MRKLQSREIFTDSGGTAFIATCLSSAGLDRVQLQLARHWRPLKHAIVGGLRTEQLGASPESLVSKRWARRALAAVDQSRDWATCRAQSLSDSGYLDSRLKLSHPRSYFSPEEILLALTCLFVDCGADYAVEAIFGRPSFVITMHTGQFREMENASGRQAQPPAED